jgi:hypothetical protein
MNITEIAVVIVIAMLLGACIYAAAVSGWRMARHDGRLRLAEALQGQRLSMPGSERPAAVLALGTATRRCILCAEHARCDKALEAADWNTLREICPNTAYIDRLRGGV